jgi:voltage-gated potassium channel
VGLTLAFLWNFAGLLLYLLPLLGGLSLIIATLSALVGRWERWSLGDSLYFGFITALTVGYGDFRPARGRSKVLAIIIALVGLVTSGIMVAVAVEAVGVTFEARG